ncbi:hypothetical protein MA5S0422_2546 [Mycobacteroides abscessus 5S-0422]|nr:hypothetical protein A3O04_13125 [Mycobacteroides abscessus]EIU09500.1 hypothetical protein MA5S0304_1611 [Mycobacteroides abscessus 5S-0304]EIU13030.1 hypothetical protein MA5S0421_1865 [Mycobacteroides abscessus 5S-0421]EIU13409.1 hypothetical protein MA5S0422_2546 [Mycobacteroides abscessus 5S-0422]EIU21772.1 hypothetical protein MA5S0708_4632 [Mycobacteroides abscessus 5S-0708]EIU25668.1 hypothetical protein MA5S0817_5420 [Mycobacteroides abscessus 5S-0817]EIU30938.1 hypothetical prote
MFCCDDPDVSVRGAAPLRDTRNESVSFSNSAVVAANDVLALADPRSG